MTPDEPDAESIKSPDSALRRFLFERIGSYDELSVLLLLMRQPDRHWSPELIAEQLGGAAEGYRTALERLTRQGLVVVHGVGEFAYGPEREELAQAAQALNATYQTNRTSIIQLMNSNALTRVRTGAVHTFGDMLRLHRVK